MSNVRRDPRDSAPCTRGVRARYPIPGGHRLKKSQPHRRSSAVLARQRDCAMSAHEARRHGTTHAVVDTMLRRVASAGSNPPGCTPRAGPDRGPARLWRSGAGLLLTDPRRHQPCARPGRVIQVARYRRRGTGLMPEHTDNEPRGRSEWRPAPTRPERAGPGPTIRPCEASAGRRRDAEPRSGMTPIASVWGLDGRVNRMCLPAKAGGSSAGGGMHRLSCGRCCGDRQQRDHEAEGQCAFHVCRG